MGLKYQALAAFIVIIVHVTVDLQSNVKRQGNKRYTNMSGLRVIAHVLILRFPNNETRSREELYTL